MIQSLPEPCYSSALRALFLKEKKKRFPVSLQESYSAGVKHYEVDDFELAIKYFEQALREYYSEDVECRALCEGPQRFEEYEYLGYKVGLYEVIAGKAYFSFIYAMIIDILHAICKNIPTICCRNIYCKK